MLLLVSCTFFSSLFPLLNLEPLGVFRRQHSRLSHDGTATQDTYRVPNIGLSGQGFSGTAIVRHSKGLRTNMMETTVIISNKARYTSRSLNMVKSRADNGFKWAILSRCKGGQVISREDSLGEHRPLYQRIGSTKFVKDGGKARNGDGRRCTDQHRGSFFSCPLCYFYATLFRDSKP